MLSKTSRPPRDRYRRAAACLMVAAALGSSSSAQQPSTPQTGAQRHLWPQRPGVVRPLADDAMPADRAPRAAVANQPAFVPNELLVQFEADVPEETRAAARRAASSAFVSTLSADGRLELLTTSRAVPDAIATLQALPHVEFAEPNWIVHHTATSPDPSYADGSLWGMHGDSTTSPNVFGSQAGEAWAAGATGSSNVYVAVIDEGIDINHPDLAPNIWTNPFDRVDGIDNDGNGKIDDVHGWNFWGDHNGVYDGYVGDSNVDSHGTHVAGTIGARGGNGIGVAGVSWNVTIISAKFLGPSGGSNADAVLALNYIVDLKLRHGLNIIATNNSWGGGGYSVALHQAIIRAAKQGILFIASAGNSARDNDQFPHYPSSYSTLEDVDSEPAASYEAVVSVAALDRTGARSSFSNYGAASVDIGAPGGGILSTWPQGRYQSISGTSMATPHVTGAVALYKSAHPAATAAEIRAAIVEQGIVTPSLAGITVTGRRLNAGAFSSPVRVAVNDLRRAEGHSGTNWTNSTTVSLSAPSASTVTVRYATTDRTAWSGAPANTTAISIPPGGNAIPYPSTITVPAGLGTVTNVSVVLTGFRHTFPQDVDVLLVGPGGQTCVLMSDVGGGWEVANVTLTVDDAAASSMSPARLTTRSYRPTNSGTGDTFPAPAPGGPYGSMLSVFRGTDPAGLWKLYVVDDVGLDAGAVVGGWTLLLSTTAGSKDYLPVLGTLTFPPGTTTRSIPVPIVGDSIIEPSETFTLALFDASGASIAADEAIGTIVNDDFTDATLTGLPIKAIHIVELRAAINDLRGANGLQPFAFADAVLTPQVAAVRAIHISQLRDALGEVYEKAGLAPPVYTDQTIVPGVTVAKAAHLLEIRAAVAGLP